MTINSTELTNIILRLTLLPKVVSPSGLLHFGINLRKYESLGHCGKFVRRKIGPSQGKARHGKTRQSKAKNTHTHTENNSMIYDLRFVGWELNPRSQYLVVEEETLLQLDYTQSRVKCCQSSLWISFIS